jgi:hypothetical protein
MMSPPLTMGVVRPFFDARDRFFRGVTKYRPAGKRVKYQKIDSNLQVIDK